MKEIRGNLFEQSDADAICITTNGFVKSNGVAVCGRGCAQEASRIFPLFPVMLGELLTYGNRVYVVRSDVKPCWLSFPVKAGTGICLEDKSNIVRHMRSRFSPGNRVPGWALTAEIALIEQSALELRAIADDHDWQRIIIPRPGCGAGELSWTDVKPVLEKILDDRFFLITF